MSLADDIATLKAARELAAPYMECIREADARGEHELAWELYQIMRHITADYELGELVFK
jgi:hypothetical protein